MRLASFAPPAALLFFAANAHAQNVVGYQLGVTQSASAIAGDNAELVPDPTAPPDQVEPASLQGVLLTTAVTGNLSYDFRTSAINHALTGGAAFSQIIPTLVPTDADGNEIIGAQAQPLTTLTLNAGYVARYERARYRLSLGGNYAFSLNGTLANAADGAQQGANVTTLPGARAGAFSFNGRTHTVNANIGAVITPGRTWDLVLGVNYSYIENGLFTLALGPAGQVGAPGTNVGAFAAASVHTISPNIGYRKTIGPRGVLNANVSSAYTIVQETEAQMTTTGTITNIIPAQLPIPSTLVNQASIGYDHNVNRQRAIGGRVTATLGYRIPTMADTTPIPGRGLALDTLITALVVSYRDLLPGEVDLTLTAGAAQATLFQSPLGYVVLDGDGNELDPVNDFDTVRSNWEPTFTVTARRFFEPINVTVSGGRAVGPGVLGASAVVAWNASTTFTYRGEFGEFRPALNAGANYASTRGVGSDQFPLGPEAGGAAVAVNTNSAGVNAGFAVPIFNEGGIGLDFSAAYNFNYTDADPQGLLAIEPIRTHIALAALRGTWGRGAPQLAAGVGNAVDTDELDAFTADPSSGSPRISSQLMNSGADLSRSSTPQVGRRPGLPPEQRRGGRQAYQRALLEQAQEQASRERSSAVNSTGTVAQEETRARERAEEAEEETLVEDETPPIPWDPNMGKPAPPPPPAEEPETPPK